MAQFATERPGRLRAMTARTRQFLPDVMDYLPERSIIACGKKKLSHQCGPPLIGQTMTRRHRLACVQLDRRHFIWQCVDWNRVLFSGEIRFVLSNAGGKTHKQAFLGLLRAGKGSIWGWCSFVVWGKMGDQKTYFVVMQDNFNALYRRHILTSCHTISPLFLHIKKIEVIFGNKTKQKSDWMQCCCCFFFFFWGGGGLLSFLKGVDILSWIEINAMYR